MKLINLYKTLAYLSIILIFVGCGKGEEEKEVEVVTTVPDGIEINYTTDHKFDSSMDIDLTTDLKNYFNKTQSSEYNSEETTEDVSQDINRIKGLLEYFILNDLATNYMEDNGTTDIKSTTNDRGNEPPKGMDQIGNIINIQFRGINQEDITTDIIYPINLDEIEVNVRYYSINDKNSTKNIITRFYSYNVINSKVNLIITGNNPPSNIYTDYTKEIREIAPPSLDQILKLDNNKIYGSFVFDNAKIRIKASDGTTEIIHKTKEKIITKIVKVKANWRKWLDSPGGEFTRQSEEVLEHWKEKTVEGIEHNIIEFINIIVNAINQLLGSQTRDIPDDIKDQMNKFCENTKDAATDDIIDARFLCNEEGIGIDSWVGKVKYRIASDLNPLDWLIKPGHRIKAQVRQYYISFHEHHLEDVCLWHHELKHEDQKMKNSNKFYTEYTAQCLLDQKCDTESEAYAIQDTCNNENNKKYYK